MRGGVYPERWRRGEGSQRWRFLLFAQMEGTDGGRGGGASAPRTVRSILKPTRLGADMPAYTGDPGAAAVAAAAAAAGATAADAVANTDDGDERKKTKKQKRSQRHDGDVNPLTYPQPESLRPTP